jgi:hypothetical protein
MTFQFLGSARTGQVDFPGLTTGPGVLWVFWTNTESGNFEARGIQVTGLGTIGQIGPVQVAPGSNGRSFGDGAVGPAGQFMITYQDNFEPLEGPSGVHVNLDPDGLGPAGFGPRLQVTTSSVGSFDSIPAMDSRTVLASVNLEWDRSGGPHNGRVYLIYNDERVNESNDTEIVLRFSDDNGLTWSNRVRINDDLTRRSQFLPWASLDQTTGNLAVSWHDARRDSGNFGDGDTNGVPNDDAQFWAAVSTDGGVSFTNMRISGGTSNEDQAFNSIDYGDYTGLSFTNGVFYPSWADNSNSTADNPNGTLSRFDLYTAKVTVP